MICAMNYTHCSSNRNGQCISVMNCCYKEKEMTMKELAEKVRAIENWRSKADVKLKELMYVDENGHNVHQRLVKLEHRHHDVQRLSQRVTQIEESEKQPELTKKFLKMTEQYNGLVDELNRVNIEARLDKLEASVGSKRVQPWYPGSRGIARNSIRYAIKAHMPWYSDFEELADKIIDALAINSILPK